MGNPVVMYATSWCGYCRRARQLLTAKGVPFTEIDVEQVAGSRAEMEQRSGRTSVPQIFIGGQHVGGYDDLRALDARGGIEALLAAVPATEPANKTDTEEPRP
jgi:glutaredoxin 3